MKKTIRDYEYKGKKVLLRCDLNVPIDNGNITDDTRIKESLITINYLLEKEPVLQERMGDVMGGKVLPLPSDKLREARAEGKSEGISEGISALINTCISFNATKEITLERLKLEFSLTDTQANEALAKYWK